jgi:hypothetical protein
MNGMSAPPTWPRAVVAALGGTALAATLAILTRLDIQLVNAFRGARTLPYRMVHFALLGVLCAVAVRRLGRSGVRPALWRVVLGGAVIGYLAGLASAQYVAFVLISHVGAWRTLTSGADGLLIVFAVPGIAFSWLFGIVAFVAADLLLRAPWRRPGA